MLSAGVGTAHFGVKLLIEAIPEASMESLPVLAGAFALFGGFLIAWENFWGLLNEGYRLLFIPRRPGIAFDLVGLRADLEERMKAKQEAERNEDEKEKEI